MNFVVLILDRCSFSMAVQVSISKSVHVTGMFQYWLRWKSVSLENYRWMYERQLVDYVNQLLVVTFTDAIPM